jgi:hypothetical protein
VRGDELFFLPRVANLPGFGVCHCGVERRQTKSHPRNDDIM